MLRFFPPAGAVITRVRLPFFSLLWRAQRADWYDNEKGHTAGYCQFLGISRTTVWKVFSGQKGVSDNLRRKILTTAQEMDTNFRNALLFSLPKRLLRLRSILRLLSAGRNPPIFWMNIIHQIAKELSFHNVNLVYTYLPSSIDEDYTLPASLVNGNTHGIIVLNVYNYQLIRLCQRLLSPRFFWIPPLPSSLVTEW